MKSNPGIAACLVLALAALAPNAPAASARQRTDAAGQKKEEKVERQRRATPKAGAEERLEGDDPAVTPSDVPEATLANRREGVNEDAEGIVPYYNNFMTSYRLGPEDVISVSVFGLERYSKAGIVVPPDGRIDYYLIKEGLNVTGKTTRQVAEEITAQLEEYIIDPKVTVSLEKAQSARFGVIGDVGRPGIMLMTRRLSVYEAVNEAGGVLPTGKKQVVVLRWNADRTMQRTVVDLAAIEKGKQPDNYFLRPGDQVFVPGNRYKTFKEVLNLLPIISFARIFTGGF